MLVSHSVVWLTVVLASSCLVAFFVAFLGGNPVSWGVLTSLYCLGSTIRMSDQRNTSLRHNSVDKKHLHVSDVNLAMLLQLYHNLHPVIECFLPVQAHYVS